MEKRNNDSEKTLIYWGFKSSSNRKEIAESGFELSKYTMYLNDKDISNIS